MKFFVKLFLSAFLVFSVPFSVGAQDDVVVTKQYDDGGIEHKANVYQTQTPISEGNSGGPLLNNHGNLIGINTFGSKEVQSLNYAVDVTEIVRFLVN